MKELYWVVCEGYSNSWKGPFYSLIDAETKARKTAMETPGITWFIVKPMSYIDITVKLLPM